MNSQGIANSPGGPGRLQHGAWRRAGVLLILTAAFTAVAIAGRVAADADQPTLAQSMAAIAESRVLYGAAGIGRLLSGVTLVLAAWFLWRNTPIRDPMGVVPALFALSGLFTALSGACAIVLTLSASADAAVGGAMETTASLRSISGKAGFAAAGLALVASARLQWKMGGTLRLISAVSAILGIGMQLIWIDAATVVHRLTGPAFFLWLVAMGMVLVAGRAERRFTAMLARSE